ncbi:SgcJ/EcaC family oxidoreductase [Sphaerisporangium perillae]|uniref:SgcJ/EcaC family oxidoreductase n=1 Tax=Sphaerisporangium perillae TaxID=2935860 RepID=UPI00200D0D69|nr:SgcJ/EcaC family oxidoreductase [Sphaerisporangium perillae]
MHDGIATLLTRFGAAIDGRRSEDVAGLFTADCAFIPPSGDVIRGREAIETYYRARFADARRRTCHQWANLQVFPDGESRAGAEAVMTTYAFEPAVSESHAQLRVGRVHVRCESGEDGIWRFAEHRFEMAFPLSIPLRS